MLFHFPKCLPRMQILIQTSLKKKCSSVSPFCSSLTASVRYSSSSSPQLGNFSKPVSALRFKARQASKRKLGPGQNEWSVVGYSSAEALDLLGLQDGLQQQSLYSQVPLSEDLEPSCVFVTNKYNLDGDEKSKEIFFFKVGCVVFWNVPELERNSVLQFLRPYSEDGYEEDVVFEESEMMSYKMSQTENPHLEKGIINIASDSDGLVKYTFSNAIASSVKLGSWEASLDKIIDSIEFISEDLKRNANVKIKKNEVLQKTGEILALRHLINLSSDLLDTPDFYWDREDKENLFLATCSHLAVAKRTKVVNEKLNHCLEVMEMISSHLSHEHGATLEKIIIVLIAIEIVFEVLHFIERKFGAFEVLDPRPS